MDMTPGRAIYNPDETLKPLRPPKTIRPEGQATSMEQQSSPHSGLSAAANVFVPRFGGVGGNALQERLQRHQQQYLQETYHNHQQPQQEPSQQYYTNQQQHPYANGYPQRQQNQLMSQMNSMNISNGGVQDRLHMSNNSRGAGAGGGGGGGSSGSSSGNGSGNSNFYPQYPQNQTYHRNYNKHHHNNHHNNHHQPRFNNHHNYNNQHRQNHYQNHQHQQQQQNYQEQQSSNQSASGGVGGASDGSAAASATEDMQNIALDYLQTVIVCLNENPGQFDTIATRFISIFDGMENNHYVLSIAMEDIFKESIKNPNFRYMGAKLYNLLHMLNPQKDSLFHTFLKCKLDFHQKVIKGFMENHQEGKVRETALFLAELYMQLRGDDSRIYLIAENIVYSLKQLVKHVVNDNVRCICLTLKLAGYDLSTDCPGDIKEIIANLEQINSENPGKFPLASNVIALQKNNWGRKVSGSESLGDPETSKPPEPPRVSDDPVFYGPDGREITAEECEFLTNGAGGSNNGGGSTDNEDDNDLDDLDPEMDEETERDYKLFLKQANNS